MGSLQTLVTSIQRSGRVKVKRITTRKFLDSAQRRECDHGLPLTQRSSSALGEMRGSFGMCLEQILSTEKLDIEENVAILLLPRYEDNVS